MTTTPLPESLSLQAQNPLFTANDLEEIHRQALQDDEAGRAVLLTKQKAMAVLELKNKARKKMKMNVTG